MRAMTTEHETETATFDLDDLDFGMLDDPPGARPRRPRPEVDRIEQGFINAHWRARELGHLEFGDLK